MNDDLTVGAPRDDPNGSESGASFVVLGGNFTSAANQVGTLGTNTLTPTLRDLLSLSDSSNRLIVQGNAGDKVNAVLGAGFATGADQTVPGETCRTHTQSEAVLLISVNIAPADITIT